MTTRDDVLDAAQALILETGSRPSLQRIADAVGVTKQGVLHYFSTRVALDHALALRALSRVDAQMQEAARHGSPTVTYLCMSVPTEADRAAAYVSLAALVAGKELAALRDASESVQRWEAMIEAELGDPVLARIVRLTADGLFTQSLLTGEAPARGEIDRLASWFRRGSSQ